jgi:hypothetical protein
LSSPPEPRSIRSRSRWWLLGAAASLCYRRSAPDFRVRARTAPHCLVFREAAAPPVRGVGSSLEAPASTPAMRLARTGLFENCRANATRDHRIPCAGASRLGLYRRSRIVPGARDPQRPRSRWEAVTGSAGRTGNFTQVKARLPRRRGGWAGSTGGEPPEGNGRGPLHRHRKPMWMIKLPRATGGCLGARSRRRTRRPAKCRGERRARAEPRMSECGNAPTVMGGESRLRDG